MNQTNEGLHPCPTPVLHPDPTVAAKILATWAKVVASYDQTGTTLQERLTLWAATKARHHVFVAELKKRFIRLWTDTGAPISLVSESFLSKFPEITLHPTIPDTLYQGIGDGNSLNIKGSVVLPVQIGGVKMVIIAAVISSPLPHNCDILLGNYDLKNNKVDFVAPWDDESQLYQRAPFHAFPSFLNGKNGSYAISSSHRQYKAEAISAIHQANTPGTTGTDPVPTTPELQVTLASNVLIEAKGQYLVVGQFTGNPTNYTREITPTPFPQLTTGVRIQDNRYRLLRPGQTTVNVIITKTDNEPFILKRGIHLATVGEQVTELSQYDTSCFLAEASQATQAEYLGLLQGSTADVTTESKSEHILRDKKVRARNRVKAHQQLKILKELLQDPVALAELETHVQNKTKNIKNDGQFVDSRDEPTPFPEIPIFNPLTPAENAGADVHDGADISDGMDRASLPTHDSTTEDFEDTTLGLSDTEFLMHVKAHTCEDGQGQYLINGDERFFIKLLTRLLTYREAGRFRLDYNKPLSAIRGFKYQVVLQPGEESRPFDGGKRRYSDKESAEITRQVVQLLKSGILEEIRSPWSANLVLAKKAGGDLRMCLDFTRLNKKCIHLASQLPQMMDVILDSFSNGDLIFSQLDLSQAYHQLEVTEDSIPLLAFKVPRIKAEQFGSTHVNPPFQVGFKRLPFGLTDAVTAFSIIVQEIFQPYGLSPYLDDLGFGSKTPEEHLDRLDLIFTLAARYGLTFGTKCVLFRPRIKFLGHIIDSDGIRMDHDRVDAILKMPVPRTTAEVLTYNGCINFCATFLGTDLASVQAPMTDLLKKNTPRPWTPAQTLALENAVTKLKQMLTQAPALKLYQADLPTLVVTDGSTLGVGASLMQKHKDVWHPVFYLSKKFTDIQSRWNTTQHELYAVICALYKWRIYLIDKPFLVLTDHSALTYLKDGKMFEGRRLARWQVLLSEFNFHIQHKAGINNGLADCLSRLHANSIAPTSDVDMDTSLTAVISALFPAQTTVNSNSDSTTPVGIAPITPVLRSFAAVQNVRSVLVAVVKEAHTLTNPILALFKAGDRVSTAPGVWDDIHHGTVLSQNLKGQSTRTNKNRVPHYNIRFDDGDRMVLTETLLTPSTLPAPSVPSRPSSPVHDSAGVSIEPPGQNSAGVLPQETPVVFNHTPVLPTNLSQSPPPKFTVGDLVEVLVGRPVALRHHYGLDTFIPLGFIESLSPKVRVRLLLPQSPIIELPANDCSSLQHIISQSEIKTSLKTLSKDSPELFVGDVVMLRNTTRASEVANALRAQHIDISHNFVDGHLIGTITSRPSAARYIVHFGSFHSGIAPLNLSELVRLKQGPKSLLKADALRQPLPHVFTPDELLTLEGSDLLDRADTLVQEWRTTLCEAQQAYEPTRIVKDYLLHGKISPAFKPKQIAEIDTLHTKYKMSEQSDTGILYHADLSHGETVWKIFIPDSLRLKVLQLCHNDLQHFNADRTLHFINQYFYWRGITEQTRRYVGSCLTCQQRRNFCYYRDHFGTSLANKVTYSTPGKHWAVDLHKVTKDMWGYTQNLVLVDLYSRYVITVPLRNKDQSTVLNAIYEKLVLEYGADIEILCDQGSEFMNYYADVLFKTHGIRSHPIKLRTPQQNGMVERFNRTFNDHFTKACESNDLNANQWSQWVMQLASIYNASYHPEISHTPYFMLHKRDFVTPTFAWTAQVGLTPNGSKPTPVSNKSTTPESTTARLIQNHIALERAIQLRYSRILDLQEIAALVSNRIPSFRDGTLVMVYLGDTHGHQAEATRINAGPYVVISRISSITYLIQGADEQPVPVHGAKLSLYIPTLADLAGHSTLAYSALGAAQARIHTRNTAHVNDMDPDLIVSEFDTQDFDLTG